MERFITPFIFITGGREHEDSMGKSLVEAAACLCMPIWAPTPFRDYQIGFDRPLQAAGAADRSSCLAG